MLVEQIWTANAYRNFNYLIACPETGEALAVDPLDHRRCLKAARDKGWQITQVLNTHEHGDHTGGNKAVIEATGATPARPCQRQGRDPRHRPRARRARRGQGRRHGGAGGAGHPRPHHEPRVPAVAHRHAGALLRRHALQRRRRQLSRRRPPGRALRDLRRPARAPAGRDPDLSRPRTISRTICNSPWTANPTTRGRHRCSPMSSLRTPTIPWSRRSRWRRRSTPSSACTALQSSRACARPSPTCPTSRAPARCS